MSTTKTPTAPPIITAAPIIMRLGDLMWGHYQCLVAPRQMRPLVGEIPLQGEVPFGQACEFTETIGTNSVQSRICPRSCLSQSCQTSMPVTRRH